MFIFTDKRVERTPKRNLEVGKPEIFYFRRSWFPTITGLFARKFNFESLGYWRENNKINSKFPKEEVVKYAEDGSRILTAFNTTNEYFNAMNNDELDLTDSQLLRLNAEKQLKVKQKSTGDPVMGIDEKRLMHELQVHQIELEMQNEELLRANETALRKYTMLYDFAPMGYFTLNSDGKIEDLNFTGAEILRDRRFSLVGSNFKFFVSGELKAVFNAFLDKVYAGTSKESCEVKLVHYKDPLCPVYMEGIVTGDDRNCLLSVVDISGFKK